MDRLAIVSTARLTAASYIALGVTALRGPTTSYELKRYVAESTGYFWPIPHAQLYKEPQRLVGLGLLRARSEPGGRRRRHFEITDEGRSALHEWLADPTSDAPELRDMGLLKMHFGGLSTVEHVRALGEHQLATREARLATLEALEREYGGRPMQEHELMTLRVGQVFERSFAAFWRQVAEHAEDLAAGTIGSVEIEFVNDRGDAG